MLQAAEKPLAAASDYVTKKREHLDTEAACEAQGITFLPMVMESTGAWAMESSKVVYQLAAAVATSTGKDVKAVHKEMLEGSAVCVRRAKAKAVLKRAVHEMPSCANAVDTALSLSVIAGSMKGSGLQSLTFGRDLNQSIDKLFYPVACRASPLAMVLTRTWQK